MKSMDNKIRFKGYLTFEDSLKVQKTLENRRLLLSSAIITMVTLGITGFIIYKMQAGIVSATFLLLFMSAFMYGGFRLMKASARKTQKTIYEKACTNRNGTLANDKITIKKNKTVTDIPWKFFERVFETEGIITIIRDKEALSFARYMFSNDKDWSEAKKLINKSMKR